MSKQYLQPPLEPRDRCTLRVIVVCRISTQNQDPLSLEDQKAKCRKFIEDHFDGPVE